jgi:hypothetical protein
MSRSSTRQIHLSNSGGAASPSTRDNAEIAKRLKMAPRIIGAL